MKLLLTVFAALMLSLLYSCEYNNEEDLYPQPTCDTSNVTYSGTIVHIISTNCYECHDLAAIPSGIPLEGYQNLKNQVDAGRLLGAIKHLSGFSPMPKDRGSLPDCDIMKIEKWVNDGAPNN